MTINYLKEKYNQLKKPKTNRDQFLLHLNLWRALEVAGKRARIRTRKSLSSRWTPSACLALDNLLEDYFNVSN
jgi:hypothetical protein